MLTSFTGESCKIRIDLVQRNIRRAPSTENRPHGVIIAAVALPPAAPTSLSQPEISIGTSIGAPDLRHQKDKPRPSSARHHRRHHTHHNTTPTSHHRLATCQRDAVYVQPKGSVEKDHRSSKQRPKGGNAAGATSLPNPDGSRLSPKELDPRMKRVEETPRRRLQEGKRRP